jgi:hypothetical protein
MSIYRQNRTPSQIYRNIYKEHYGPIPKEENGRSYEIHHIDGNSRNNDPKNLVAVTLQEHYDIHYEQQDYIACLLIAGKLSKSPDELFELKSKSEQKKVSEGRHNLLKRPDGTSVSSDFVKTGNHPLARRHDGSSMTMDRVLNGTNPFTQLGANHPKYLKQLHIFKNKNTGEIIESTYYDFRTRFNYDPSNVRRIIMNKKKSYHGWQVI